jgi:hypothetical protein
MINVVLKIQENKTFLKSISHRLFMEEFFIDHDEQNIIPRIEDLEITVLTRDDMAYLGNHEERS